MNKIICYLLNLVICFSLMPAGVSKPKSYSDILKSYSTQNPVSFEDQQNRTDYFQALNALAKSQEIYKKFYDKLSPAEQNNYQVFDIQELSSTATKKSNASTTWNRIKHTVLSILGNETSKTALITTKIVDQNAKLLARYAKISAALLELEKPLSSKSDFASFLKKLKLTKDDFFSFMLWGGNFQRSRSMPLVNKLSVDLIVDLISKAGETKFKTSKYGTDESEFFKSSLVFNSINDNQVKQEVFEKLIAKNSLSTDQIKPILMREAYNKSEVTSELWSILLDKNIDKFIDVFAKFSLADQKNILEMQVPDIDDSNEDRTILNAIISTYVPRFVFQLPVLINKLEKQVETAINFGNLIKQLNKSEFIESEKDSDQIIDILKFMSIDKNYSATLKEYVNKINNLTAKNLILQMLKEGLQNDPQAEYLTKIFLKKLGLQDNQLNGALEQLKKFPKFRQDLSNINNLIKEKEQAAQQIAERIIATATVPKDPAIFGNKGTGHQFDELPVDF